MLDKNEQSQCVRATVRSGTKARVLTAFSEIQEDTCIITHGGVIAAIMAHLFPEENKNLYQWQPKPGCGYAVEQHNYTTL